MAPSVAGETPAPWHECGFVGAEQGREDAISMHGTSDGFLNRAWIFCSELGCAYNVLYISPILRKAKDREGGGEEAPQAKNYEALFSFNCLQFSGIPTQCCTCSTSNLI